MAVNAMVLVFCTGLASLPSFALLRGPVCPRLRRRAGRGKRQRASVTTPTPLGLGSPLGGCNEKHGSQKARPATTASVPEGTALSTLGLYAPPVRVVKA